MSCCVFPQTESSVKGLVNSYWAGQEWHTYMDVLSFLKTIN